MVVACVFFFIIPNFPEETRWLTEDERAYVIARLRADQGQSARHRPIVFKDFVRIFGDYKNIAAGFMYFGLIVPAYSFAYFAPGIIQTYGYSPIRTQLFSVPPYAAAFVFSMAIAAISDWAQKRMVFAIFSICIAIAGFGVLVSVHDNTPVQYGALVLVSLGTYTAMPLVICWYSMNLGGHHRRAIGSAWQIGFGNIGGIIAVFAFLAKDAPRYVTGYSICLAFTALTILACVVYGAGCYLANKSRDKSTHDLGLSEYEKTELGDLNPEYRYFL